MIRILKTERHPSRDVWAFYLACGHSNFVKSKTKPKQEHAPCPYACVPSTEPSGGVVLRPRVWEIVSRAVESGVAFGYRRAHKHTPKPSEDHVREQIELEVMNALSEVIDFER